ncbi:MAG TPA: helix-turn-helix domain-containing protein [Bacteroidales bacterium]|nr:helix-turn-helix domain-containing protein [Bacteroidales bacterium]
MKFQFVQPAGILSQYIKHYWILESDASEGNVTERVIPTGNIELMFHYGEPFRVMHPDENTIAQPRSFISGLSSNYADVSTQGQAGVIAVTFYPFGACNFFHFPLADIEDASVDLLDIFNKEFRVVEEKIHLAPSINQKVAHIEAFLLKHFNPVNPHDFSFLNYSISVIAQQRGMISASDLSEHLCVSTKSLERKFATLLGKTPKQFLKIVRFQEIIKNLSAGGDLRLTELAYETGYFDQAHFIKDFKMLSGYTPREFLNFCPCNPDYSG